MLYMYYASLIYIFLVLFSTTFVFIVCRKLLQRPETPKVQTTMKLTVLERDQPPIYYEFRL